MSQMKLINNAAIRSLACCFVLHQQQAAFVRSFTFSSFHPLPNSGATVISKRAFGFRSTSPTQLAAADKKDESFTTWTYEKPCLTMSWNELLPASLSVRAEAGTFESLSSSDLVMVGVQAPPKEKKEDKEDDDEEEETEAPVVIEFSGFVKEIDESLGGALASLLADNDKEFKKGAKMGGTTPTLRVPASQRYIAFGLGQAPSSDDEEASKKDPFEGAGSALGKAVASKCHAEKKAKKVSVIVPDELAKNSAFLQDFSASFYGELYADNRFKTGSRVKKVAPDLESVTIVSASAIVEGESSAESAIEAGKGMAKGILMTKDIVNAPHNVLNSLSLAETAKRIAVESGGSLSCKIMDRKECEKKGMGAFLGVARGSETEPQFIHITYKPKDGKVNKKVGVVGKGLLFDTGGYNIKTQMMELMKFDCGGAAATLGAARAIGALKPPGVEAHFFVAACENMINEKAYVASDILTASNGKTIEVMNTDAEGRLTLADALVYADKEIKCEEIIELSTLTGACMVALGKTVAGMWTSNETLATELLDVSKVTGDKIWRMPLEQSYAEELESKFADMKNVGGRYGGSITAALFLTKFVSSKKPFAHIDIAGPVWSDKSGATGFGAKFVVEWVRRKGL